MPTESEPLPGADRQRWTSTLLLGLGFAIVVGAAVSYLLFGREPTAGVPVAAEPPVSSSRPPTTTPQRSSATPIAPPATVQPSTAAPGEHIDISGIREHRTVSCTGNSVEIGGISNVVVLAGPCGQVTVSGIENAVTLDTADAIDVSGIHNRVTFHTGAPAIKVSGDNSVEQG